MHRNKHHPNLQCTPEVFKKKIMNIFMDYIGLYSKKYPKMLSICIIN